MYNLKISLVLMASCLCGELRTHVSEQDILACSFLHSLIQAQVTLPSRKAVTSCTVCGFLGKGLPSRRAAHVPVDGKD